MNRREKVVKLTEQERMDQMIQYLRISRDLEFDDSAGRSTIIRQQSAGFILNRQDIVDMPEIPDSKKIQVLTEMERYHQLGFTYAVVDGYPCPLCSRDFKLLDSPPFHCISEIL